MVTVPRGPQQRVGEAALPAAPTPTQLRLGVQEVEQVGAEAQALARQTAAIVEQENKKVQRRDLMDLDNQLAQRQLGLATEIKGRRGKNARNATEDALINYEQLRSELEKDIDDPEVAEAFLRAFQKRRFELEGLGRTHELNQDQQFTEEVFVEFKVNKFNEATENFDNNEMLDELETELVTGIMQHAADTGKSQDWIVAQATQGRSQFHISVINRKLANGLDRDAKEYLSVHKDDMSKEHVTAAERVITEGSTRQDAQRIVDSLMLQEDISLGKGFDELNKIPDEKLRRESKRKFENRMREQNLVERQERVDIWDKASKLLVEAPTRDPRDLLSPAEWTTLKFSEQEGLRKLARSVTNNDRVFGEFMDTFGVKDGAKDLAQMDNMEYQLQWAVHFNPQNRVLADRLRKAAQDDIPEFQKTMTDQQSLKFKLQEVGILKVGTKPTEIEAWKRARWSEEFDRRVNGFQEAEGRKITPKERDQVIEAMADETVLLEQGIPLLFWELPDLGWLDLNPDDKKKMFELTPAQLERAYITEQAQIPNLPNRRIRKDLEDHRIEFTPEKAVELYNHLITNDKQAYNDAMLRFSDE